MLRERLGAAGDAGRYAADRCVTTLMGEIIDLEKLTDGEKTELLKIYRLWVKHREKLYPEGCRGEMIRRIDLDTLHQNFFGCVSSFLIRGVLTGEQKEYLYACDDDLGIVPLELRGYEGFYFRQMKTLTLSDHRVSSGARGLTTACTRRPYTKPLMQIELGRG